MGVYLPGSSPGSEQERRGDEGARLCPWCGELIDPAAPCVSPPAVQRLLFHPSCAAEMGQSLIADAREAMLAGGDHEWSARAVALVRYRLGQEELR
jgi:hypothetical protein